MPSSRPSDAPSKPLSNKGPLKAGSHRPSEKSNVRRSFRNYVSALIMATRTAEKAATASNSEPSFKENTIILDKSIKDSVDTMVRQRQVLRQATTMLEGKLRGNMKESEALLCCLKSQPCVGGERKRKFTMTKNGGYNYPKELKYSK